MTVKTADLRQDYNLATLDEADAAACPFDQFEAWFKAALEAGIHEPNAMTLATVSADGRPHARTVLLKDHGVQGFTFFTNYESDKARELEAQPHAALLFFWSTLHRQVRIEGSVSRVEADYSNAYFASRPYGSRIGAAASPQSRTIPDRAWLEAREAELRLLYPEAVPRPAHWGGFRVEATRFEFWQGRTSRLHDRLVYTPQAEGWKRTRLAP